MHVPTPMSSTPFVPSARLIEQIRSMVAAHEDYIPEADGVDDSVHVVINDFTEGVWLCEHHDQCNMHKFTRIQRLAETPAPGGPARSEAYEEGRRVRSDLHG